MSIKVGLTSIAVLSMICFSLCHSSPTLPPHVPLIEVRHTSQHTKPQVTKYRITDLGIGVNIEFFLKRMNSQGQIVGGREIRPGAIMEHAFLWSHRKVRDIGGLPHDAFSVGNDINDAGQIALDATNANVRHACLWQNGKLTPLTTPDSTESTACAINKYGAVVGSARLPYPRKYHALLWRHNKIVDIGTLGGGASFAYGINSLGEVVGEADPENTKRSKACAFLWQDGHMRDIGTLGGDVSKAISINDRGLIVGESVNAPSAGEFHAFIWDKAHGMHDMGTLGGKASIATQINNLGIVVGGADTKTGERHAFIWQNGRMQDLNAMVLTHSGWVLRGATSINNNGLIAGKGVFHHKKHAFLLTPI